MKRFRIPAVLPLGVVLVLILASAAQAQAPASPAAPANSPAVIKPGDNLVADGLPEIPAEIAETVGRYTEFRSASLASWHPTKREMLISTRFGDSPQVHEVRFPLGARRQLTFFPDRVGQLELAAPLGRLHRLHQGQGRRRVRPDPPPRRGDGRHHACSRPAGARRTASAPGRTRATAWPSARPAATGPTATST